MFDPLLASCETRETEVRVLESRTNCQRVNQSNNCARGLFRVVKHQMLFYASKNDPTAFSIFLSIVFELKHIWELKNSDAQTVPTCFRHQLSSRPAHWLHCNCNCSCLCQQPFCISIFKEIRQQRKTNFAISVRRSIILSKPGSLAFGGSLLQSRMVEYVESRKVN